MSISIQKVNSPTELKECLAIRKKVFIEGQKVPLNEEVDGKDKESTHYLLTINQIPAGVARVRYLHNIAKIERVAILPNYQGQGLGKHLMQFIIADLKQDKNITIAKLGSQSHAILFYEKLGFTVYGQEYMDAGIPHKDMMLNLK
ncbi:GNAT family acetyltransferase [Legionella busanensis]|uniref:GNAT family acetyltransferase n=1 Tax=Legionella busanensis TaxID=190655 RepID=A0A378JMV3_9GAMM|nr:GNAT family N-acetyltransferase [Legionella busanensis]STX52706.1 GNAT family acetyltransferase [Legionella busanensis]